MKKKLIYIVTILIGTMGLTLIGCSHNDKKNDEFINIKIEQEEGYDEEKVEPIFKYSEIPEEIKEKMLGKSMPKDTNISFDDLAYIKLTCYGFDKEDHIGEMVVDKRLAEEVVDIFKELYEKKYPIEKVKLIDEYNADDKSSMNDNNTSAFCYRTIKGTDKLSNHGKGRAIDINPFQNPHVIGDTTNPEEACSYIDRTKEDIGIIRQGDDCYNAFVSRGWTWGGHWKNPDYQHFEKK